MPRKSLCKEVDTLLRDGLAALRANNAQGNQGGDEDEQPDRSPQSSGASDESSSDSDNNAAGDDPACDRAAPAVAHLKGTADAFFVLPGDNGIIRHYNNSKQFTAECKCGHQKCIKTRQSTEAASVAPPKKPSHNALAKGRPLGYLTAWLLDGHNLLKMILICCIYSIPKVSCKYSMFRLIGSSNLSSRFFFMRPFLWFPFGPWSSSFEALAPSEISWSGAKVLSTERQDTL